MNYQTGQDAGFIRFFDAAGCTAAAIATGATKGEAKAVESEEVKDKAEGVADTTDGEAAVVVEATVVEVTPLMLGGAAAVTAVVEVRRVSQAHRMP